MPEFFERACGGVARVADGEDDAAGLVAFEKAIETGGVDFLCPPAVEGSQDRGEETLEAVLGRVVRVGRRFGGSGCAEGGREGSERCAETGSVSCDARLDHEPSAGRCCEEVGEECGARARQAEDEQVHLSGRGGLRLSSGVGGVVRRRGGGHGGRYRQVWSGSLSGGGVLVLVLWRGWRGCGDSADESGGG